MRQMRGYAGALAGLGQKPNATIKRRPAPSRGWNAFDPLHAMKPDDAVVLDNWFPGTSDVTLRNGYESFATGMTSAVETLIPYASASTSKLLACGNNRIYEISSGTPSTLASGLTNNRWQWTQFRGFIVMVNGADNPKSFDGTTIADNAITGSGLTDNNFIQVNAFKNRLFFIEENSLSFWYLPVDTISGAATEYDLTNYFKLGGKIMAMGSWTRDGGDGVDDIAVFVTNKGEVAVFQGSDPDNPADWAIVGIFRIGEPIGRRCILKYGPDLIIITRDGAQSCERQLSLDRASGFNSSLSQRIGNAFNLAAQLYSNNFGWEGILYPRGQYLLFNIPVSSTVSYQFVVNTVTGAWCRFTNQNAYCWTIYNDELYFGGTGTVYKADVGESDDGSDIPYDMLTAYVNDGIGNRKTYDQLKMYLTLSADIQPTIGINVDFIDSNPTNQPTLPSTGAYLWDSTFIWDVTPWSADTYAVQGWTGLAGVGTYGAIRLKGQCQASVSVNAFDITFRTGGFM